MFLFRTPVEYQTGTKVPCKTNYGIYVSQRAPVLSSPAFFSWVPLTQSLVFCAVFVILLLAIVLSLILRWMASH